MKHGMQITILVRDNYAHGVENLRDDARKMHYGRKMVFHFVQRAMDVVRSDV